MRTSEDIIQGLLDQGHLTIDDAMTLLKDLSNKNITNNYYGYSYNDYPNYPVSPFYATTTAGTSLD